MPDVILRGRVERLLRLGTRRVEVVDGRQRRGILGRAFLGDELGVHRAERLEVDLEVRGVRREPAEGGPDRPAAGKGHEQQRQDGDGEAGMLANRHCAGQVSGS